MSLADARIRREQAKRLLTDGLDPAMQRDMERNEKVIATQNTFEAIALDWFATRGAIWSKSHANRVIDRLRKEVFPHIGRRPRRHACTASLPETAIRPLALDGGFCFTEA